MRKVIGFSAIAGIVLYPPLVAITSAGIVNMSTVTPWLESDTSIVNLGQSPLLLGTVDSGTGQMTDGDYLLYVEIDLGSAPLQSANLQVRDQDGYVIIVQITPAAPTFTGVFPVSNSMFIVGPEGDSVGAFKIRAFRDLTAPIGAQGALTIKTALVTSTAPNLATAPGVIQETRYFITGGSNQQFRTINFVEFGGAE